MHKHNYAWIDKLERERSDGIEMCAHSSMRRRRKRGVPDSRAGSRGGEAAVATEHSLRDDSYLVPCARSCMRESGTQKEEEEP